MAGLGLEALASRAAQGKEIDKLKADQMAAMVILWLDELKRAIASGERVNIRGFGTFFTETKDARTFDTPVMTQAVDKPAHRVVRFRASGSLKQRVSSSGG